LEGLDIATKRRLGRPCSPQEILTAKVRVLGAKNSSAHGCKKGGMQF
jgi:hypothetical protein